ncbi:hypothetical protein FRC02_007540 [Tulasnella sp. 418]|nr:hypothetical protein FRC02_007540 [Tulasnella sp. 418]
METAGLVIGTIPMLFLLLQAVVELKVFTANVNGDFQKKCEIIEEKISFLAKEMQVLKVISPSTPLKTFIHEETLKLQHNVQRLQNEVRQLVPPSRARVTLNYATINKTLDDVLQKLADSQASIVHLLMLHVTSDNDAMREDLAELRAEIKNRVSEVLEALAGAEQRINESIDNVPPRLYDFLLNLGVKK